MKKEHNVMSNKSQSIYIELGRKIGYWYASNRDAIIKNLVRSLLFKLPGGRWLSRFF